MFWSNFLLKTQLACLHDQSKDGFFEGPAFSSQSGLFENFSDCSDWLDKSRTSKTPLLFCSCIDTSLILMGIYSLCKQAKFYFIAKSVGAPPKPVPKMYAHT